MFAEPDVERAFSSSWTVIPRFFTGLSNLRVWGNCATASVLKVVTESIPVAYKIQVIDVKGVKRRFVENILGFVVAVNPSIVGLAVNTIVTYLEIFILPVTGIIHVRVD